MFDSSYPRVAVVVHAFYDNLMDEVFKCLFNFRQVCGDATAIYVTCPIDNDVIPTKVKSNFHDARIIHVDNAGYDVGPFFRVLSELDLDEFDYIVKIHTKRDKPVDWVNFHCFKGGEWRRALMSFCSSEKALRRSLEAFQKDARLGMIADRRVIDPSGVGQGRYPEWFDLSVLHGLGYIPKSHTFVYGTMFIMRAGILKPVQGKVLFSDFLKVENPHVDYGLALDWELAFSVLAEVQGYRVADSVIPKWMYPIWFYSRKVKLTLLRCIVDLMRDLIGSNRMNVFFKKIRFR